MVATARAAAAEKGHGPAADSKSSHAAPAPKAAAEAAEPRAGEPATPPISDSERAVLLELRQRCQELDSRDLAVTTRESVLAAAEQRLATRVDELQTLQKRLESLEAARRQREDASWQGLVKLYETMKPRDAAAIFNDLAMPVLLQVLDRMKEAKAALVLSAMNPDKAREVTTELARMRTGRDMPPEPVANRPVGAAPRPAGAVKDVQPGG
jgi:flagellar motility protein MotE (MotC chaperone)